MLFLSPGSWHTRGLGGALELKEMRILSPCGMLGYGFPETSLRKGLERRPDVIAVDAGSTDAGPQKLGAGTGTVSRQATKKDLLAILAGGHQQHIPVIIGSAGGAGAKSHVDWSMEVIEEIVQERGLSFDTAVIYADIDRDYLHRKLDENKIEPLGPVPELTHATIDGAVRIVGQMGCEPIIAALDHGAQLIVAGRAYDPAPFAALPIRDGFDPALAMHLGKILECGALCAAPGTTKDAILGYLRDDHFIVEALDESRKCHPTSVAAHTLYEKGHPYILPGPGIELDLSECAFEAHSENSVQVSGSRASATERYAVKLEGSSQVAFRTIFIAGVRDPILIENIDEITGGVVEQIGEDYREVPESDYQILFHIYGKNAVMGGLEPHGEPGHEIGIVMEVVASTQELANAICATARSTMLHYPYAGRKSTAGNLAFLYSPSDIPCGPVYKFTVYHLVEVDDPCELFRTGYRKLG
jgi:hypothetical protein